MESFFKIVILILAMLIPAFASAGTLEDYTQAKKEYHAAGACMAAYEDRYGNLAVAAFEQQGWEVEKHMHVIGDVDVNYVLAWDSHPSSGQESYVLAVAGAENILDVKILLRSHKVYFAGSTLEEFAENAALKVPPDVPEVHNGFNQVAQLLLTLESTHTQGGQEGKAKPLTSILLENPNTKVFLSGHSMGGAVVTVIAARLLDMGVHPEQIEVITFGATAAGNELFVQKYENRFPITRIVVKGDPVPIALQRIYGGYRQLGEETVWPEPLSLKAHTEHDVSVYLDIALNRYYPLRRQAINEGVIPAHKAIPGTPLLYVAPIKNSLPKVLQQEFGTMREILLSQYENILPGFILDSGTEYDKTTLGKAAEAGCDLLAAAEIQAIRVKEEENLYFVSLIQTVYLVKDGSIVSMENFGSNTKMLTPTVALVLDARSMRADSPSWANIK